MPGTTIPNVPPQFFTNSGAIASGYKLFSYLAGTTTKQPTYSDVDLAVPNTNPIVLDASGRATIFLAPTSYKFVFAAPGDTDPPASPIWTRDNVDAIPTTTPPLDVYGTAGEAIAANDAVYLSAGSGGTTAGRWYKASTANSYSAAGASIIGIAPAAIAIGAQGAIRRAGVIEGMSALTPGALYYIASTPGAITSTPPGFGVSRRVIGVADSLVSLVVMGESAKAVIRPRVAQSTTSQWNVAPGPTTIFAYIVPAGEMSADGMSLTIRAWGKTANTANAKTIKLLCDASEVLSFAATTGAAEDWYLECTIIRSGSTTARAGTFIATGPTNGAVSKSGTNTAQPTTAWATGFTISLTATSAASDDILGEGFVVYEHD